MFHLRSAYVPPIASFVRPPSVSTVRVGADATALTETGAGAAQAAAAGIVYLIAAGASGLFSYALFTGKWIFENKHPVWGVIFALGTMSGLYGAANKILGEEKI